MWTQFWDMHSGGSTKEPPYQMIYIEASELEATRIFYNRFHHNPNDVACPCCGSNYSLMESENLEQATAHHRHARYDKKLKKYVEEPNDSLIQYGGELEELISLEDYEKQEDVLIIRYADIELAERLGQVPSPYYPEDDEDDWYPTNDFD